MPYHGVHEMPRLVGETLLNTFKFSGRSTRTEVVAYYLATILVGGGLKILAETMLGLEYDSTVLIVFAWVITVPFIALFVRRMKDQEHSGWLALFPMTFAWVSVLLTALNWLNWIDDANVFEQLDSVLSWLAMPLSLVGIVLLCFDGTVGPNRYGPDPRGREA